MTNEKRIEEIKRGGASLTIFFTDGDEKRIDYDNQQGEYTRDEWREQLLSPVDIGGYGIESEEDVEGLLWYLEMSSNTGEFFAGEYTRDSGGIETMNDEEYKKHMEQVRPIVRETLEWLEGKDGEKMGIEYDFVEKEWQIGILFDVGDRYNPQYIRNKFIYDLKGWNIRDSFPEDIRYYSEMEDDEEAMARYPENSTEEMVYSLETKEWGDKETVIQNAISEMEEDIAIDILREFRTGQGQKNGE